MVFDRSLCNIRQNDKINNGEDYMFSKRIWNCFAVAALLITSTSSHAANIIRSQAPITIGTKGSTAGMSIVNPVAGRSGIYSINDGNGGTYPAYVDMNTNGGYWILLARWSRIMPAGEKTFAQIAWQGQPLSGWTDDTANYPSIPSGVINSSSQLMFVPGHPSWISRYGTWQSFSTFSGPITTKIDASGIPVNTSKGADTLYGFRAGWKIVSDGGSPFGLWTQYGNSGACGGAGIVGKTKMCLRGAYESQINSHFDYTYLKQLYLKATN